MGDLSDEMAEHFSLPVADWPHCTACDDEVRVTFTGQPPAVILCESCSDDWSGGTRLVMPEAVDESWITRSRRETKAAVEALPPAVADAALRSGSRHTVEASARLEARIAASEQARPRTAAAEHWANYFDRMGPALYARSQGATTPEEAAPFIAEYREAKARRDSSDPEHPTEVWRDAKQPRPPLDTGR